MCALQLPQALLGSCNLVFELMPHSWKIFLTGSFKFSNEDILQAVDHERLMAHLPFVAVGCTSQTVNAQQSCFQYDKWSSCILSSYQSCQARCFSGRPAAVCPATATTQRCQILRHRLDRRRPASNSEALGRSLQKISTEAGLQENH